MAESWQCGGCGAWIAPHIASHCGADSAASASSRAANSASNGHAAQGFSSSSKASSSKASPKNRFQYNDPDFAEFWNNYPLKRGKEAALKAWQRVMASGVEAQVVAQAAARYAADPQRNVEHTKYPQGWLSDGRWMDYDEPTEVSHPAMAVEATDPAWIVGTPEYKARQEAEWGIAAGEFEENAGEAAMAFLNGDGE